MPKTATATAEEETKDQTPEDGAPQADAKQQVQSVEFPEAVETESAGPTGKFDILLDMRVPITVALGQTEIPIRRLLQLAPGSILELGRPVEAPVEVYLRDAKFATGDVVVVDDRFAVRIRQVIGASAESETTEP